MKNHLVKTSEFMTPFKNTGRVGDFYHFVHALWPQTRSDGIGDSCQTKKLVLLQCHTHIWT